MSTTEDLTTFVDCIACCDDDVERVQQKFIDCNIKNIDGCVNFPSGFASTALGCAARFGFLNVTHLLVDTYKADVNVRVNQNECRDFTALHLAAWNGHFTVLRYLIEKGANTSRKCNIMRFKDIDYSFPLLHCVVFSGDVEAVKYVVEEVGVDMEAVMFMGTALIVALRLGFLTVAQYLVSRGAKWNSSVELLEDETCLPVAAALEYYTANFADNRRLFLIGNGFEEGEMSDAGVHQFGNFGVYTSTDGDDEQMEALRQELAGPSSKERPRGQGGSTLFQTAYRNACMFKKKGEDLYVVQWKCKSFTLLEVERNQVRDASFVVSWSRVCDEDCWSRVEFLRLLDDAGADFNYVFSANYWAPGDTYLHLASRFGSIDAIQFFVSKSLSCDAPTSDEVGKTPLLVACGQIGGDQQHYEVTKCLVAAGANKEKADNEGTTPLINAARGNFLQTLRFLLDERANKNKADNAGRTPLYHACYLGYFDAVKALVEAGADINKCAANGRSPFVAALLGDEANPKWRSYGDHTAIGEYLLGRNAGGKGKAGPYALLLACCKNDLDAVKRLMEVDGVSPALPVEGAWSYLRVAVCCGHDAITTFLMDKGADGSVPDSDGVTPFFEAIQNGDMKLIKYMLSRGVDINHVNTVTGETALHLGPGDDVIKLLVEEGCNVNAADKQGRPPLFKMVDSKKWGAPDCLRCILDAGADVGATDSAGKSVLHFVRSVECLQILADERILVNAVDNAGRTPLMDAACEAGIDCIQWFVENGADVNIADKSGATALHSAVQEFDCWLSKVEYLLDQGADINAVNADGKTALDIATANGADKRIVDCLTKRGATSGVGAAPAAPTPAAPAPAPAPATVAAATPSPTKDETGKDPSGASLAPPPTSVPTTPVALSTGVVDADPAEPPRQINPLNKHIMMSYCWAKGAKPELVKALTAYLRDKHGYDVCRDEEGSSLMGPMGSVGGGSTDKWMAEAIEKSHTIIVFVSREYIASVNCEKEAKYAHQRKDKGKVNILYVMMQEDYVPWKGDIEGQMALWIGDVICYPLWDMNQLEGTAEALCKVIGDKGKLTVAAGGGLGAVRALSPRR